MSDETRAVAPVVERDAKGRLIGGATSLNPGGVSKQKREFLKRLTGEDFDHIYRAFMELVLEKNVPAVIRAVEYVAGRPTDHVEISTPASENIDLSKLTADQLDSLERLLALAHG